MTEIARLRIELDEVAPPVVRCVEVPIGIRLDHLHFVLQVAVGWHNGHPFEFRIGETAWGLADRDAETQRAPADRTTLADVLTHGTSFKYDYIFGEDWQHTVALESIAAVRPGVSYPHLVSAEGRCPPEDIGGPLGYETYLRTISDPNSMHHEAMREFDEPDFDPSVVDAAALRRNLAELARYIGRNKVGAD